MHPLDQSPGLVRVVALRQVAADQRQARARIEVEGDPGEGALRLVGLLLEGDDPAVVVGGVHAVALHRLEVADVIDGLDRRLLLEAELTELLEPRALEDAVSRRDQQVVVEAAGADDKVEVADGAQLRLVALRAVVDHLQLEPPRPAGRELTEVRRELCVGDDVDAFEGGNLLELAEQPLEDRVSPDLEQRLRLVEREGVQPRGVPRCENDSFQRLKSLRPRRLGTSPAPP